MGICAYVEKIAEPVDWARIHSVEIIYTCSKVFRPCNQTCTLAYKEKTHALATRYRFALAYVLAELGTAFLGGSIRVCVLYR